MWLNRSWQICENEKGDYLIDGTVDPRSKRPRYGTAELYVDRPGFEAQRRVTRRKLIVEASNYIMNDERGYEGRLLVAKVLGRDMKISQMLMLKITYYL